MMSLILLVYNMFLSVFRAFTCIMSERVILKPVFHSVWLLNAIKDGKKVCVLELYLSVNRFYSYIIILSFSIFPCLSAAWLSYRKEMVYR